MSANANVDELKRRMTGEREEVSLEDTITRIKGG